MTTLVVLACAVVLTIVLVVVAALGGSKPAPLDTEREERWLVRHAPERIRPALRYVDRKVAGGIMVAVAFAALFAGALLVGWVFDSIDRNSGFARWDKSAAQWGADHATKRSTSVLNAITALGATRWLFIVIAAVGVLAVRRRGWGALGYLAVVGLGVSGLNNGLKLLVQRDRPNVGRLVGFAGSSFPSGHSAAAAACWAALALVVLARRGRAWRAAGAIAAMFVSFGVAASRVLLGVHWLTDVIAGLAVGWTWFLLCTIVFGGRLLRFGEPAERVAHESELPTRSDQHALAGPPPHADD
ncbi:MAG: phosphatase PAP2 family protein [Actinomycetota bacterium]|nr:phosphatase PAP2 family protein [Actinomycetota bacterium]